MNKSGQPTAGDSQPSAYSALRSAESNRELAILRNFDERELGAGVLFVGLITAPLIIVFGIVFLYLALIA